MKLANAIQCLSIISATAGLRRDEMRLEIVVDSPGAIGGTPTTAVESVLAGIDWDRKKVLIRPEKPLSPLTTAERQAIVESARKGQSWHAYQAQKKLALRAARAERALLRDGYSFDAESGEWHRPAAELACADANVESLRKMLLERSDRGISKYGVTTDQNALDEGEWQQHMLEELLDAAVYLRQLMREREHRIHGGDRAQEA